MSEKEQQIMDTLAELLPQMTPEDKAYLLGFGEGLAASLAAHAAANE